MQRLLRRQKHFKKLLNWSLSLNTINRDTMFGSAASPIFNRFGCVTLHCTHTHLQTHTQHHQHHTHTPTNLQTHIHTASPASHADSQEIICSRYLRQWSAYPYVHLWDDSRLDLETGADRFIDYYNRWSFLAVPHHPFDFQGQIDGCWCWSY